MVVMRHFGLLNRDQAAMGYFADHMFELERCVVDAEALAQHNVDAVEDEVALRRRNVGDGDVTGEGVGVGAEAPDVQVVDVFDAVDGCQCGADLS